MLVRNRGEREGKKVMEKMKLFSLKMPWKFSENRKRPGKRIVSNRLYR